MNVGAEQLRLLLLLLPGLLLSLTIHEFAHARVALAFGDPTANALGRVSLNPLRHLEPVGTIMLVLTALGGFPFGWAKPVPVNPVNLNPRRLGDIMVSLAGPASNLVLAAVALVLLKVWGPLYSTGWINDKLFVALETMLLILLLVNISLAIFNLIPLFPLDGHHILRELLPPHMAQGFMEWQLRYGRIVLMALLLGPWLLGDRVPNPLGAVLGTIRNWVFALL